MYRTPFVLVPLVLLIVAGLLLGGGLIIHQAGWSEGYRVAQLADGAGAVPPPSYGFGGWGLLATLGIGFLLLLVLGRILHCVAWTLAWRQWSSPHGPDSEGRQWWADRMAAHRHWHHPRPAMPPWCAGWHQPPAKEPDAPASTSGATPDRPENQPPQ